MPTALSNLSTSTISQRSASAQPSNGTYTNSAENDCAGDGDDGWFTDGGNPEPVRVVLVARGIEVPAGRREVAVFVAAALVVGEAEVRPTANGTIGTVTSFVSFPDIAHHIKSAVLLLSTSADIPRRVV